ncbi:carbohydrate porin [Cellvibrio sp. OA-2007]|uniref:carbohydrate porin n=1 Tax=Cellvibrio sp. OA-2007 TaxID=529823 RepID=UPI00078191C9|nr:carbohydrate porin [Cellvibrio sp. OA-2007]
MKKTLALCLSITASVCGSAYAESPYEWGAALTLESVTNLDGGVQKGSSELANLDLTLAIDTESAGWWDNGEWFVYVLGDAGANPSDDIGDVQGVSNIATDEAIKLYEFWYQHSFANDSVKVLFGLHDYNSTFYSLEAAGLFTHPSFGIGPDTSQVGPSIFSTTATALHFTFSGEQNYLLAAIYDGIPGDPDNPRGTHVQFNSGDGVFGALEWGWVNDSSDKIALGAWQHTAEVENPVSGEMNDKNTGVYFIAEKNINDVAAIFLQLGQADDEFNQLAYYGGTGVTFNGFWQEGDGLGLAVAYARNGDPYLVANSESGRAETAWELTYFAPLVEHLSVQGSFYYIQNPAMEKRLDDALAVGARAYIEF